MFFKVIAEGPFGYISNGFNVFDGVIVVLSVVELGQTFLGEREGSSGLSVLRTFRLLRILKLVRFMPNLRRQLFVMLRTMDNVAVFFSLLVLFIFIFSILGMYLFGGKFCTLADGSRECNCQEIVTKAPHCICDRKHFNNMLWATVTVFQRHERREREQRELAKQQQALQRKYSECYSEDVYSSCSLSEQDSCFQEAKSERDMEILRKVKDNGHREKENSMKLKQLQNKTEYDTKCNIQKENQMMSQTPIITHTAATPQDSPNATLDGSTRDFNNRISNALQFYSSSLSIDSIDCSVSSQVSIPGMLKVPTLTVNNLNPSQPAFSGRRASVTNNDNSQL
ncbi:unnamed protein product [Nezara viridula]|uniref:Ion transport domain-containing protein n=1 Tax=Nezara viridula TaxID=85310 RepID=A0A9P0E301_NEZVI|nr:unnamed protein product [Nezara viridula]